MTIPRAFSPEKLFFGIFLVYFLFRFLFPTVNNLGAGTLVAGLCFYWLSIALRYREAPIFLPAHLLFLILFCLWSIVLTFFSTTFEPINVVFFIYVLTFSHAAYFLAKKSAFDFVAKSTLLFLSFQLFIALGQAAKIQTGVGFEIPASRVSGVSEGYLLMTPGTFFNKNDLSAVSALSFIYFLVFGHYFGFDKKVKLGLLLSTTLVLITTSRSSVALLVLLTFLYLFFYKIKSSIFLVPTLILFFFGIWLLMSGYRQEIVSVDIAMSKIENISRLQSEVSSESSRGYSYVNFLKNIGNLGAGSGDLRNYGEFIPSDAPRREMLASVPHSLVVELGYWGGWPLLVLFFFSVLSFKMMRSFVFSLFSSSFLILTFVSSSVIGNFAFFWVFFNGFHLCLCMNRGNADIRTSDLKIAELRSN